MLLNDKINRYALPVSLPVGKQILIGLLGIFFSLASKAQVVNFTSSDLPVVIINTSGQTIVDDPKIVAQMGIINNGVGNRNAITDSMNEYSGSIGIEFHGQSSQMFPMKSFGIELREADGETSQDVALFGLPAHSDWILYAPYTDKTLMRNFITYTMAREMGRWAANCSYEELILDGQYQGIYVLEEQIRRDKGRVNISKLKSSDISGDNVTGGYILRIDKDYSGFNSKYTPPNAPGSKILFNYYYPKAEDIVAEQQTYIAAYTDSFENALATVSPADTVKGYRHFADMNSFVDYFISNELSRNVDGYRLSTYFYKDKASKDGKFFAGPVWDYDLAYRNANYCDGSNSYGWAYQFNYTCPSDYWQIPFWWNNLMTDTAFTGALRCRWKSLRSSSLSETRIDAIIDSVVTLTAEARERHFTQWPVLGQYIWPNPDPIPADYDGEIAALKQWIHDRLTWLDANMPNAGACSDYPADAPLSYSIMEYPVPFSSQLTIQAASRIPQTLNLRVTNVEGRTIMNQVFSLSAGNSYFHLNTGSLAAGVYFFRYDNDAGEHLLLKGVKIGN